MSRRRSCFAIALAPLLGLSGCARSHLHGTADDDVMNDAGEPVSEQRAPLCRFDAPADADAPVLAGIRGHSLFFLRGDGRVEDMYQFSPAEGAWVSSQLAVSGEFIAGLVSWGTAEIPVHYELVLMDRKGTQRYVKLLEEKDFSGGARMLETDEPIQLNDQGNVTLTLFPYAADAQTLLIDVHGNERIVPAAVPIAAPTHAGAQAVVFRAPEARPELGWIMPGESGLHQVSVPHAYQSYEEYSRTLLDDRFVYVSERDDAPVLVLERPGDARVLPLPRSPDRNYRILDVTPEAVLLHHTKNFDDQPLDVSQFVRVLLADGSARNVELPTQGPLQPAGEVYLFVGPRLDADGALLAGLRDASGAGLYRTRDAMNWQRIGDSMAGLHEVYFLRHSHTYLIAGEQWTDSYGPMPAENGQADYPGSVLQVVNGKNHVQVLDHADQSSMFADEQMSADGRCVLYSPGGASTPSILDVERGKSFAPFGDDAPSYPTLRWME